MFANHNNLYLISLVCVLALFIAAMVYLRRRDKRTWKTLILLAGAFLIAILITARLVSAGEYSPTLFAPGLGVSAAALLGLLVATLFGPQKPMIANPSELNVITYVPDNASTASDENQMHRQTNTSEAISQTINPDCQDPMRPNQQTVGSVSAGNVSLIEIDADLEAASNDGGLEQFADIDESIISPFADSVVLTPNNSNNEPGQEAHDATDGEKRWKAPVTSLHERRAPGKADRSTTSAISDDVRTALKTDSLDFSETERLFRTMRDDVQGVDLPDNDQWIAEAAITHDVDLSDEQIIVQDQSPVESPHVGVTEAIMDAEFIDDDEALDPDSTLSFGDELTGEYARPESDPVLQTDSSDQSVAAPIPETLDEALIAAKQSAAELKALVQKLRTGVDSFNALRDQQLLETARNQLHQADSLIKRDRLLEVEAETHAVQDKVMLMQRKLLQKTARRQQLVSALLNQERRRLAIQQEDIDKARRMARQAAAVARKAASAQQAMLEVARREQSARVKAQDSARKAMEIARNAINALNTRGKRNGTHF